MSRAAVIVCVVVVCVARTVDGQCTHQVPSCAGDEHQQLSLTVEYRVANGGNGGCITSNTTQFDVNRTRIVFDPYDNNDPGTFCIDEPVSAQLMCSSNTDTDYPNHLVLFVSGSAIHNSMGLISIDLYVNSTVLFRSFFFEYAPQGIYPVSNTTTVLNPEDPLILQWKTFGVTDTEFLFKDINFPGNTNYDFRTDCITSSTGMGKETAAIPRLGQLDIANINIEESGIYTIRRVSNNGHIFESAISVSVTEQPGPPQLTTSNNGNVFRFEEGTQSAIMCDVFGSLQEPVWYFNGVLIESSRPEYRITQKRLRLLNATQSQAGSYLCEASNEYEFTQISFLVIVGTAPKMLQSFSDLNYVVQNESLVVLPCITTGTPDPEVRWSLAGTDITSSSVIDPTTSSLVISNFTSSKANYGCRQENVFGLVEVTNTVTLSNSTLVSLEPSTLHEVYNLAVGKTQSFQCHPEMDTIQFKWYVNGTRDDSQTSSNITIEASESGREWGHYCCQIETVASQAVLDTRCTMIIVNLASDFVVSLTNASVRAANSISFVCSTSTENGIDFPRLSWYKDGELIQTNNSRFSYSQDLYKLTTLFISNVEKSDEGYYTCRGNNFVNTVESGAQLKVVDVIDGNLLNSAGAEESVDVVQSAWGSDNGSSIVDLGAGSVFRLSPETDTHFPTFHQTINVTDVGGYTLYFSCHMQSDDPLIVRPEVNVTVEQDSMTVRLAYPLLSTWQWVSGTMNITSEVSNAEIGVTMQVERVSDSANIINVSFDDLSLSLQSIVVVPSNSTSTSASTPTSSPSPSAIYENQYFIIAAVAVFVVVTLVLLCVFGLCCWCCCISRRKIRKSDNYELEMRPTKPIWKENMNNSAEYIDQFMNVSDGHASRKISTGYTPSPHLQAPSPDTQPVYIEQPSAHPVYMANDQPGGMSLPLPSPPPNDIDAYEEVNQWEPKSKSVSVSHAVKVEDTYDNPTNMNPSQRSFSSPTPHSVADSNNMYMSLDQNSREQHVYASTTSIPSPTPLPEDTNMYESLNNGHISAVQQTDSGEYSTVDQPPGYLDVLPSQDRMSPSEEDNYYVT